MGESNEEDDLRLACEKGGWNRKNGQSVPPQHSGMHNEIVVKLLADFSYGFSELLSKLENSPEISSIDFGDLETEGKKIIAICSRGRLTNQDIGCIKHGVSVLEHIMRKSKLAESFTPLADCLNAVVYAANNSYTEVDYDS